MNATNAEFNDAAPAKQPKARLKTVNLTEATERLKEAAKKLGLSDEEAAIFAQGR